MALAPTLPDHARTAYETLAPAYDVLTGAYAYEQWLDGLEQLALSHGLRGRRLLDLACGTGESFLPMLARGYEVTGCDISEAMLERARRKAPDAVLHQADLRQLPRFGSFDLVTCIDDPLNYILEEHELEGALRGIARNLAPGGVAVWDLNTLAQYRQQFSNDRVLAAATTFIGWRGETRAVPVRSGERVQIAIDVFTQGPGGAWDRSTSIHHQRHWPRETVARLASRAGLRLLDVRGQHPGAVIDGELRELVHTKAIYVARRTRREDAMRIGGP